MTSKANVGEAQLLAVKDKWTIFCILASDIPITRIEREDNDGQRVMMFYFQHPLATDIYEKRMNGVAIAGLTDISFERAERVFKNNLARFNAQEKARSVSL
jgi:hypothetical protein